MAELAEGPHSDVVVERVTLRGVDGVEVEAIHARPEGMPGRGIALHPDIMGIRPLFDDLCRRLATQRIRGVLSRAVHARACRRARRRSAAARMAYVPQLDDELADRRPRGRGRLRRGARRRRPTSR